MKQVTRTVLGIFLAIALSPRVPASTGSWDVDASANWSVNDNWTGATYPNGSTEDATLGSVITADRTITLTENITVSDLIVNDNNQYTLTGGFTLNITDAGTTANGITMSGAGGAKIESNVTFSDQAVIQGSGAGALEISGILGGSSFLSKNSTGTLILSGTSANTYSGRFFLNSGTVILNKPAGTDAFGSSGNSIDVGFSTGTDELRWLASNQIPDTRSMTVNAAGVLNLNGYSESINTLTIKGGIISNGTIGATGVIGDGGTISADLSLNLAGATAVRASDGNTLTVSGNVSGNTMSLSSSHAGTVVLTGNNTQNGIDLINGTLVLGSDTAVGSSQLRLMGGTVQTQGTRTIANLVRLPTSVIGTFPTNTFAGSDALTFTGPVSLDVDRTVSVTGSAPVKFTGNWTVAAGTPSLTKIGAGTLEISGASVAYGGETRVKEGTLVFNGTSTGQGNWLVSAGATVTGTGRPFVSPTTARSG